MSKINLYKKLGLTPLQTIQQLRVEKLEFKDSKMTYAGRLDPMAEGVLLVLSGDDRFKKDEYLKLDKTYEAEFLIGFKTDSFDTLGLVEVGSKVEKDQVKKRIEALIGNHSLKFPPYSSYKVNGKPLHFWARSGRLSEIEIPIKEMNVLSVKNAKVENRSSKKILKNIEDRIQLVKGDFRQEEILMRWKEVLSDDQEILVASVILDVTSGTYIRSLAQELGKKLGSGACLLHLIRTSVGKHKIEDSIRLNS